MLIRNLEKKKLFKLKILNKISTSSSSSSKSSRQKKLDIYIYRKCGVQIRQQRDGVEAKKRNL